MTFRKGRYEARYAKSPEDLCAAQRLRHLCFQPAGQGSSADPLDQDRFDSICQHVLIEEQQSGAIVGSFRLLHLPSGSQIGNCYSAQFYDLSGLEGFDRPMVEVGRFCIHPVWCDPDILRVAWGALTRYVDDNGVELLFGCTSFQGTEPQAYSDAFEILRARHLAPKRWLPRAKAAQVVRFATRRRKSPDLKVAMRLMPPLLRTYLQMGGWVSDHAVVDPKMNTMHVFTGVEIRAIPPARKRLLRLVAQ